MTELTAQQELIRGYFTDVHEAGDAQAVERYVHPDLINHVTGDIIRGRDKLIRMVSTLWAQVPHDRKVVVTFTDEQGDDVFFNLGYTGTQTNGQPFEMSSENHWTIKDGLIYEARNVISETEQSVLDDVKSAAASIPEVDGK